MCDAASAKRVSVLHSKPRQSKATFVLPWTTGTKKGGPENGPKKWPALALHTRPGDRKRTPFFQDAPAFFVFVSERAPKSPSSFAIAAWQCPHFLGKHAPRPGAPADTQHINSMTLA